MARSIDYFTYLSPFTWRYSSAEMRRIWSEANKRRLWRTIWTALAEVEAEFGVVTLEQAADLRLHQDAVDVERALEIEAEIHHDLMAELKAFAAQAPLGGPILHLGATSADIEDNADVLRIRQALELVLQKLESLLLLFARQIDAYAGLPLIAFTHLQPAEPSTFGYRLAGYAQDLLLDHEAIGRARRGLKGKGFKGAVGTGASYAELLGGTEKLAEFEAHCSTRLSLPFFPISTQVYPRKQDYQVVSVLAGLGASLYKFAFDLRLLQSPPIGEIGEPFGRLQVGSSAMPFKRNPINAEKIDSLARALAQAPRLAWDNAAHSLLERTLDDSANRRFLLPEAFLITDELLITARRILSGLQVDEDAMRRNLDTYGPFAALERLLIAAVKAGADRQALHEILRGHAMQAWEALRLGQPNPLRALVAQDAEIGRYLSDDEIMALMDAGGYVGDAPARAHRLAGEIRAALAPKDDPAEGAQPDHG
jgi:adenylosuccinate lyase